MYLPVRCPEMTGDDRPGRFREMHDMGFAILGTMGCNAPRSGFRVDLNWARLHNFLTALTSERQEFDDPAVRPRHLARRNNDCGELVVGQNTISADLPVVRGEAFCGRRLDHRPAHAPAEERLQHLEQPVAGVAVPLGNLADEINDIALLDVMDALGTPIRNDIPSQAVR